MRLRAKPVTCGECGETFYRYAGNTSIYCSDECGFLGRVEFGPECWTWIGGLDRAGYGYVSLRGIGKRKAHRFSYELSVGPIPDELPLDHLCRNPPCVNPDHLEPVTHGENFQRGDHPSAITHRTNVCKRGHSMDDPANVYVHPQRGHRNCRTCMNLRNLAAYYRRKEAQR